MTHKVVVEMKPDDPDPLPKLLEMPNHETVEAVFVKFNIADINQEDDGSGLRVRAQILVGYYRKWSHLFLDKDAEFIPETVNTEIDFSGEKHYFPLKITNAIPEKTVRIFWECHQYPNYGDPFVRETFDMEFVVFPITYNTYDPFTLKVLRIIVGMPHFKVTKHSDVRGLIPDRPLKESIVVNQNRPGIKNMMLPLRTKKDDDNNIMLSINQKDSDVFFCSVKKTLYKQPRAAKVRFWPVFKADPIILIQPKYIEKLFKFIGVSTLLLSLLLFTTDLDLSSLLGTNLTLILAQVALLFVLEDSGAFTTTECVLVGHLLILLVCTILTAAGLLCNRWIMGGIVGFAIVVTILFVTHQRWKHIKFVQRMRNEYAPNEEGWRPEDKIFENAVKKDVKAKDKKNVKNKE